MSKNYSKIYQISSKICAAIIDKLSEICREFFCDFSYQSWIISRRYCEITRKHCVSRGHSIVVSSSNFFRGSARHR